MVPRHIAPIGPMRSPGLKRRTAIAFCSAKCAAICLEKKPSVSVLWMMVLFETIELDSMQFCAMGWPRLVRWASKDSLIADPGADDPWVLEVADAT